MGMFSWVATITRKSQATALIQQYFEVSQRLGGFQGDAALTAKKLADLACNRVPSLPEQKSGRVVLAARILSVDLLENELPLAVRDQCAMALNAMLLAAQQERHMHSYEDQEWLKAAVQIYERFREIFPASDFESPVSTADKEKFDIPQESSRDRERAMDELIRRMKPQ